LLAIFPAGEVSHFQWKERSITDPKWNPAIARMLAIASRRAQGISVIPVYVEGSNSLLFQAAGLVHPRLRTIRLGRELLNKRRANVEIRIGSPIDAEKLLAIPSDEDRTEYLRWRTYLLASRHEYKPMTALPFLRAGARAVLPACEYEICPKDDHKYRTNANFSPGPGTRPPRTCPGPDELCERLDPQ
jgi:putative hemolysin